MDFGQYITWIGWMWERIELLMKDQYQIIPASNSFSKYTVESLRFLSSQLDITYSRFFPSIRLVLPCFIYREMGHPRFLDSGQPSSNTPFFRRSPDGGGEFPS